MINYEKPFDSIEIGAVLNALNNARIDYKYENATS